jgi:hypothetical protein
VGLAEVAWYFIMGDDVRLVEMTLRFKLDLIIDKTEDKCF